MFRPIRRKKKEMDIDAAKELLQCSRRGVLAVNGDDGYPYAVPVNYFYDSDAGKIYFHGARTGHKVDALKASDKVCFTVYGNETVKEDVLGTLGVKIQTVDKKSVYIGGIKNNKLWFGLFDNKTKEKIKEWKDNNEFERIVSTNNGYGNYVDVNIDYLQQTDNIQTENGLCVLLYPQNHKAIFINDNKISSAALIPRNKVSLKTWYNKSILIQSEEEYCENDYFVYSDEGELITSFHNIDAFDEYNTDTWYPCSYTEVIGIGLRACWYDILRVALDSPYVWEEIVWSTQIDLFLSLASSYSVRMTSKLISINDNLWEMEYEAVKFSGDRIKTHFIIKVENGHIVYQ